MMRTATLFTLIALLLTILSGCAVAPLAGTIPPMDQAPGEHDADDGAVSEVSRLIDENPARHTVAALEFLGATALETGYSFADTEVGGLSGVDYDAGGERYYLLSDDRSERSPARIYVATVDLADGELGEDDVQIEDTITLLDETGAPFEALSLDPEGLVITPDGTLLISSEGDVNADPPIAPFIREFTLAGEQIGEIALPERYLPAQDGGQGIRHNLAFESLTITPDGKRLVTALENALAQDGPAADLEQESLARILVYDLAGNQPLAEHVYVTEPVLKEPEPADAFRVAGLVDLLPLDNNGSFLALERSFSVGHGHDAAIYEMQAQGALDVLPVDSLFWEEEGIPYEMDPPVQKRLLLDIAELGITPDNLEGMVFGPTLDDGRRTLLVVSDNNFSEEQENQFLAFALTLDELPTAEATLETPYTIDDEEAPADTLAGDSDDPAIWLHPEESGQSLVIAAFKDGGMVVFDLAGQVVQEFVPDEYGGIRYNNVDVLYGFDLGGEPTDLAIASDRENDTLAVFAIDPASGELRDVTSPEMPETIFGIDDGEQTAYGLGTYVSPWSGEPYTFVTQRDGDQVAQLQLIAMEDGTVTAEIVRMLAVPMVSDDVTDSQSEGVVADRVTGYLYVAMEEGVGILKFDAEPEGSDYPEPLAIIDHESLQPDIEGLTIYYGPGNTGYLLVSSQGDSSYAVFDRAGDNAYLGSFVIGDAVNGIDQANESDGADVINVALGDAFPNGLLVVQDGANDPQNAVPDDEELENNSTNFKFVPWEHVAEAFPEALMITPDDANPRP